MSEGLVYKGQDQEEKAKSLWQEALQKLNKDSPEYEQVREWLQ